MSILRRKNGSLDLAGRNGDRMEGMGLNSINKSV